VKDFAFASQSRSGLPRSRRTSWTIAAVFYVLLVALLISIKTQPKRAASAGPPYGSMVAYVPGPIGGAPAASTSKPVEPKKPAMATRTVRASDSEAAAAVGVAGAVGAGQGTGPVRLGSGGSLTLIKKVQPIYPPLMQTARVTGQVVLDAIIHPDGTIGDIKVLSSTNDAFAQSAIAAVKQWLYTAPGFEGILTVNVNFSL
jgi:TonB family protein